MEFFHMLPTEISPEKQMQQFQKQSYQENYDDRVLEIQEEEK